MKLTVGVDEVGRGPWAGPLVAAAVVWPNQAELKGLTDSKLLRRNQRLVLCEAIKKHAIQIGIGWVDVAEIDHHGLSAANRSAMLRALDSISMSRSLLDIIIDGNVNYLKDRYRCRAVVRADSKVPAVAAASIVAKVARDNYMAQMNRLFPNYGFDRHVGYGTVFHRQQLSRYGPSTLHRRSFAPIAKLGA